MVYTVPAQVEQGDELERDRETGEVLTRLRRVEGQVRGIQRMVEEERDCEAIVTQLLAARAALDKASLFIMTHHIERCLLDPSGHANRERLERIMSFFLKVSGVASQPTEMEAISPGTED